MNTEMAADTKENIRKAKKDVVIAESLDNTASFKSIFNSIDSKRRKEKSLMNYLNCTVRRRHKSYPAFCFTDFVYPSLPRNVFTEHWDGGLNSGFFESTPHKSMLPRMISTISNVGKEDPVTQLVKERYNWNYKWKIFRCSYSNSSSRKRNYKWFDDDVLYCPKWFPELAEHLVNKPDEFFEDCYNWYYAGKGNMHIVNWDGSDYLIHSEFNCLFVTPFFKDTLSINYENSVCYKCSEDTNILETIQSQKIIALRTKCKIVILKITICEKLDLEKLKEMDSELPFTSIAFDEYHKNIMYVTTLDSQLTIVNLDRMASRSRKLRGKFQTLVDNWSTVIGAERGCYAHITKKAITLYDKRTNEPYQRWKSFKYISDIESCAQISAAKYCQGKPLLYVATDHHLFLTDMRCSNTKEDNMKPIQRWTHGMLSTPTYLDICTYDHNNHREVVSLGSQWFEDMCLVNNHSDRLTRTEEISALSLPYRPPSIMQTFNEAQRRRMCCNLYEPIRHRLCTSITGLSVVEQGDNYSVLTQNSMGDICCHTLYPRNMFAFIEDDGPEQLHEWSKGYKEKEKPFEVTIIVDIKPLLRKLKQVPDDFILGRNIVIKQRNRFNENEIYETYAKEELDPEFLEVWKDREEELILDKTNGSKFYDNTS